jgi:hypothetical protein
MKLLYLSFLLPALALSLPLTLFPRQSSLEAETDRLLFSTTMAEFQIARESQAPSELDWTSNGCSFSPEEPLGFDFEPSCQRHDFGYRNYKAQGRFSDAGKASVDDNFKRDMDDQCATEGILEDVCGGVADVYYQAVVNFGSRVKRVDHLR